MINSEAEYNQMLSDNNEYQYNNQMKQSSIAWVRNALQELVLTEEQVSNTIGLFAQAEEMHKDEIMDAHIEGQREFDDYPHTQWTTDQAEDYYKKTFTK